MTDPTTPAEDITNVQFAERVGVHFTMASRLRTGQRLPSIKTLLAVHKGYGLTCDQLVSWLEAIEVGPKASGQWLQENIFASATGLSEAG